jgi:hypothetical protein
MIPCRMYRITPSYQNHAVVTAGSGANFLAPSPKILLTYLLTHASFASSPSVALSATSHEGLYTIVHFIA